jgi:biopolymer transport protein TolR
VTSFRRPETSDSSVRPDINVTPLVDVVLVLLIIFMVVAPRLEQDVQVILPGIFNPDPDVDAMASALKVTVAHSGEYFVDDQRYDLDGAIERLGTVHAADPLRRLILRADQDLPYGDVRELFARAQKVGFPGMALMVGEKHRHDAPTTSQSGDAAG